MFKSDEIPGWVVACLCVALPAAFFLLTVVVGYFEKKRVWPYGAIDATTPAALPYHRAVAKEAGAIGLIPVGAFGDIKGTIYRIRYEFWLAQERDVLAIVGGGTIANIPMQATWLYTALSDGRVAVSTDHQSGMEPAPGDPYDWGLRIHASPSELLSWHRDRVLGMFAGVKPFDATPARALAQLESLRRDRAAGFVDRGLARFRDEERSIWSYSALGSLRVVTRMYFKGFHDALTQPFRSYRTRPGQAGFRGAAAPKSSLDEDGFDRRPADDRV